MKHPLKHSNVLILPLLPILLLAQLTALHANDTLTASNDWDKKLSTRRTEYLEWIVKNFGKLEPAMDAEYRAKFVEDEDFDAVWDSF